MSKITPGLWSAECVGTGDYHTNPHTTPVEIYEITNGYHRIAEYLSEADARAIAEVPAMMDALKSFMPQAIGYGNSMSQDLYLNAVDKARAILKRIEG